MQMQTSAHKLRRIAAGCYETLDGKYRVLRTEWDGPAGGKYYLWEIATPGRHGSWEINTTLPWRTKREAVAALGVNDDD